MGNRGQEMESDQLEIKRRKLTNNRNGRLEEKTTRMGESTNNYLYNRPGNKLTGSSTEKNSRAMYGTGVG